MDTITQKIDSLSDRVLELENAVNRLVILNETNNALLSLYIRQLTEDGKPK